MPKKVSFSGEHQSLEGISKHYIDIESALRHFYATAPSNPLRFTGYTVEELLAELHKRLAEEEKSGSFSVLASLEAAFRMDYLNRVYLKKKDALSRSFRAIHKKKNVQASLDEDIFEAWARNTNTSPQIISNLKGAFKFRHWIAHGRYWTPKLGSKYDYHDICALAELIHNSFPLLL